MSEKYTPGEGELIEAFTRVGWAESMARGEVPDEPKHRAEAQRGIAKIKADAFDEALGSCNDYWPYVPNPYRENGDNNE